MNEEVKANAEQLLEDFSLLNDILKKVPMTMIQDLAESCFEFYVKHGKLEPFVIWALKREVENTNHYGQLFREETFGTTILRRILGDDIGIQYLKAVLFGVCKDVIAFRKPITRTTQYQKICSFYCNVLTDLLNPSLKTHQKLPSYIYLAQGTDSYRILRIVLKEVQKAIIDRFPESNILFVTNLLFFYYFCPAFVNPKKYGVIRVMPDYASIGFLNISKLINDIALNATERVRDPVTILYIQEKHKVLLKIIEKLIDEVDIENSKVLAKTASFGAEEKKMATKRFQNFLNKLLGPEIKPDGSRSYRLKNEDALNLFERKLNHTGWKKFQEKKEYTAFSLKEKDEEVIVVKSVGIVEASIEYIVKYLKECLASKEWNSYLDFFKLLYREENYSEYYISLKTPFPLTKRDIAFCENEIKVSETRTVLVHYSIPDIFLPPPKDCIRSVIPKVGGWNIEVDKENPSQCRVTYIIQNIPGGSLPVWLVNAASQVEAKRVKILNKALCKK